MTRHRAVAVRALTISFTATLGFFGFAQVPVFSQGTTPASPNLRARAARDGHVRVLVQLRLPGGAHVAEGRLSADAAAAQRRNIGAAADRVWSRLPPPDRRLIHRFASVPFVALEVGPKALATLESAPDVVRVIEDEILRPTLAESVPLIQGDQAWAAGYDGVGTTIAVCTPGTLRVKRSAVPIVLSRSALRKKS